MPPSVLGLLNSFWFLGYGILLSDWHSFSFLRFLHFGLVSRPLANVSILLASRPLANVSILVVGRPLANVNIFVVGLPLDKVRIMLQMIDNIFVVGPPLANFSILQAGQLGVRFLLRFLRSTPGGTFLAKALVLPPLPLPRCKLGPTCIATSLLLEH